MDSSALPTVELLGVRFHPLTSAAAAAQIAALVKSGGRGYVVKPYSEFMPRAVRDPRLRAVLNAAALCLPDGAGILWAAHYMALPGGRLRAVLQLPLSLASLVFRRAPLPGPFPEAMAGVDFTWEMLAELDAAAARVFLLGGRPHEVEGARHRIEERFHRLQVVGASHGYFDTRSPDNERVLQAVSEARPHALLVAMGFPRQEQWIAENLERLPVNVAVAEGGSFSFISRSTPRAPKWMRAAGLEWLFRLLRQPWRIRRQLALPVFVWLVFRQRLRR